MIVRNISITEHNNYTHDSIACHVILRLWNGYSSDIHIKPIDKRVYTIYTDDGDVYSNLFCVKTIINDK